jgi:uncharacterized membrane protein
MTPSDWISIVTWVGGVSITLFSFLFGLTARAIFYVRTEASLALATEIKTISQKLHDEKEHIWQGMGESRKEAQEIAVKNAAENARSLMAIQALEKSLTDYKIYISDKMADQAAAMRRDMASAIEPVTKQINSLQSSVDKGLSSLEGQVGLMIDLMQKKP